jgi:hypothetical protein
MAGFKTALLARAEAPPIKIGDFAGPGSVIAADQAFAPQNVAVCGP